MSKRDQICKVAMHASAMDTHLVLRTNHRVPLEFGSWAVWLVINGIELKKNYHIDKGQFGV